MTSSSYRASLRAAVAACAVLLAACTPSVRPGGSGPAPDLRAPSRTWTPEAPASEISRWVRRECGSRFRNKAECVERTLVALIDQTGIGRTMEVLDTLVRVDGDVRFNAHALAHGLGIAAYRTPETMAATFADCPPTQMSGCFHGVIQGYFLDMAAQGRPVGAEQLDALCAPHAAQRFIWFHCSHGMGHGLMALHQHHLPMALESCEQVSIDFVREGCYSGAIMENVMQVTHPHHTAGGHAQTQGAAPRPPADPHAEHGGHAAAGAAGGDAHAGHGTASGAQPMRHGEWRALDPADMLYPCNVLDRKYQLACYGFQPSPVMYFNGGDVAATAVLCGRVPADFVTICFKSLGREVTTWSSLDPPRMIEMCGRVGEAGGAQGRVWCLEGAVETLINQTADARDGIRFCRAVEGEAKESCYSAVGRFMTGLVTEADGRARQCAAAEPEFVATCRRAAQADPPAAPAGT